MARISFGVIFFVLAVAVKGYYHDGMECILFYIYTFILYLKRRLHLRFRSIRIPKAF